MYLVIDIGGTFVKYALMDATGKISGLGKRSSASRNLAELKNILFSIIDDQDLSIIKGIALSCPGTIDVETGIISHGGSFPFLHEVNLAKAIIHKYEKEVSIENDAKCAALAELWQGSVKNAKDSVVLVLGSGVGGGIIIDRKIHRGINLSAGEVSWIISHISPVTRKTKVFGLECSAVEMIRRIGKIKGLEDPTDGEIVFNFINQKDEEAMAVFEDYCIQVAAQILNLQSILDPEIIAIGGGISAQPILLEQINWAIAEVKKANPLQKSNPRVVTCQFGNNSNLYGALYHFLIRKESLQKQIG